MGIKPKREKMTNQEIRICVHVIGSLRRFARDQEIYVPVGATPRDILQVLQLPQELKIVALINGKRVQLDSELRHEADLKLVTLATGG